MKKLYLAICCLVIGLTCSCGKKSVTVYKSGATIDMTNNVFSAAYFKGTEKVPLLPANTTIASSIFVKDGVVYSAGAIATLGSTISVTACYWKNSEKVDLGTEQGIAESIFVDKNNDVYVAGIYGALGGSDMRAAYWKNGVLTILSDEQSYGFSIYVYNGKVYVAGSSATSALYWVDGVKHELSTNNAIAMGLFVYNGDVYVSGTTGNMANPVYWVNDKEVALTDGSVPSIVTSIYVRNGVVYTAGLYGIETSSVVYWKNAIDASSKAEMISLPVGSYTAKLDMSLLMFGAIPKIFVDEDNNVYATSSLLDPARSTYIGAYWYNGSLTPNEEAIYSSVFVE